MVGYTNPKMTTIQLGEQLVSFILQSTKTPYYVGPEGVSLPHNK